MGVPVPAHFAGGIVFRVGRADEAVPQGGITHLVEHVAMTGAEDGQHDDCNAFVDASLTGFGVRGEPADVAVLTWKDGARVLIGHDGASILFAQDAFRGGAEVARLIWQHVPHDRWVPMDDLEASPLAD